MVHHWPSISSSTTPRLGPPARFARARAVVGEAQSVHGVPISLDGATDANVAVFDILGRRVSTVFRGRLKVGTTQLAWNGRHDDGSRATAGVYFYRLEMNGRVVSRRLVLLRPQ